MVDNSYMTEGEFCERYLVSPRTAQRWRHTGEGPAWCRFGARRVAYRVADCETWAAGRTWRHRAEELSGSVSGK